MVFGIEVAENRPRRIVGMMCGTSSDGLDAALVEVLGTGPGTTARLRAFATVPFETALRERIFAVYPPLAFTSAQLAALEWEMGTMAADLVERVVREAGLEAADVDAVSHHGLCIHHADPDPASGRPGEHIEIGEASIIAARTGIPTLTDLRMMDVAAGGSGAPLTPYVDWVLFQDAQSGRAIQNLGGIGNVTGIPPAARLDQVIAFDTGPANMVIDGVVTRLSGGERTFDHDGAWAAQGTVDEPLLTELMDLPFICQSPPKSTGRNMFGAPFAEWLIEQARRRGLAEADLVATATAYTAASIADAYHRFLFPRFRVDEVVLGGGGVHNPTLVRMIAQRLAPIPVHVHEDFGINGDAREAISWAILANESLHGHADNVPHVTGARRQVVLGKLISGQRSRPAVPCTTSAGQ